MFLNHACVPLVSMQDGSTQGSRTPSSRSRVGSPAALSYLSINIPSGEAVQKVSVARRIQPQANARKLYRWMASVSTLSNAAFP